MSQIFEKLRRKVMGKGSYVLGVFGAAVYFVQHSDNFWMGFLGIFKALVWPAMIVYKALELLKM